MPPMSMKNTIASPAASDLGLGDMLKQQVDDESEEAKKRAMMQARMNTFGPAAGDLLGGSGATGMRYGQ